MEQAGESRRFAERLQLLSEIIGAFAEHTTDLAEALRVIVKRIAETMRDGCLLTLLSEDETALIGAARYHVARGLEEDRQRSMPLSRHPLARQILSSGRGVLLPRIELDALSQSLPPEIVARFRQVGIHSGVMVPMRARGQTVGMLSLTRDDPASPSFGAEDLMFLQTLADHAALTIVNAKAFEAERRAREATEEVERVFFEKSPVPMFVIDIESRRALAVNEAAGDMYGYTRAELLELPIERLRAGAPADDVQRRLRALHDQREILHGLTRHVRRDGTEFDVEYVTRPTTFRGHPALVSLHVDVTERVRAAEANARLANIVDSSEDAIISKAPDGTITSWNRGAERIFGYREEEILGKSILVLFPPERVDEEARIVERLVRGEFVDHFETVRVRKDGRRIDVSVKISPVFDTHGKLVGASKVARDITDRKRLAEGRARISELDAENRRIQEANRLKSQFLANMSHELRTPLNAIIGFAGLLRAGKAGAVSATQHEYLGDILTSGRHLLQLINDILDLAKVESGRISLTPEPVDVAASVQEVKDTLGVLIAEKQLHLTVTIDAELDRIVSDARTFKQILFNYLSNAIKFTPADGVINVNVAGDGPDHLRLDVTDSGIGIRPEDLPKLFVEFQQVEAGLSKQYPGTGLGLALTKKIVEALGGSVSVESTPGRGSRFSARLPRVYAPSDDSGDG